MANNTYQPHKSSIGDVDANYIAVACYGAALVFSTIPLLKFVAWLAPLAIYFLEKKSVLVKFHAVQALILNAIGAALSFIAFIVGKIIVAAITPDTSDPNYWLNYYASGYASDFKRATAVAFIFGLIAWIIIIGIGIFQVLSALSAYKYAEYKIPVIGGIANKVAEKLSKVNFDTQNNGAPSQAYTPPTQPTYSPPVQPTYAPPAAPMFDTQTGLPITPPPAQKFDAETGLPITPPQP